MLFGSTVASAPTWILDADSTDQLALNQSPAGGGTVARSAVFRCRAAASFRQHHRQHVEAAVKANQSFIPSTAVSVSLKAADTS